MSNKYQSPLWLQGRSAGVLFHPSSLPGAYGIGSLGSHAYQFVDFLEKAGFSFWQMCPVGPTGFGDSPYQVFSSSAGNPYFIDWDKLIELNLLESSDLSNLQKLPSHAVDYGSLYAEFYPVARLAYAHFKEKKQYVEREFGEYNNFINQNPWLKAYASFQAIKLLHENQPWWMWGDKYRHFSYLDSLDDETIAPEVDFQVFLQYLFWGQWKKLKSYANRKGISLLGDLPIYAAPDSSDVWAHQNLFQLDQENSTFQNVAGVPPDYFNQDGQLWGNPLYDWQAHAEENFSWWIDRLNAQLELFDVVRIDHFRAFHNYWCIPSSSEDAKAGKWENGPGMKFWNRINDIFPKRPFLAEDLGLITDEIRSLRGQAGLPGMAVLQFAFDGDEKNLYLPHNLNHDLVLYLGTHDNDTTCGWYDSANEEVRGNFRSYLNVSGESPSWDLLRFAYRTISPLVIVPMQDLVGLGNTARFNSPGEPEGNWQWRCSEEELYFLFDSADYLKLQAKISGRLKPNE